MPSFRSTAVVFLIALACVMAAVWTSRHNALQNQTVETSFALFSPGELPVNEVERIALVRRDEPELIFQRNGAEWRQVAPLDYPVDPYSIRQFAIGASGLEAVSSIDVNAGAREGGDSLKSYSLAPPLAVLTFEWNGGIRSLRFGRKGAGGRAYLQTAENGPVYVVDQSLHLRAVDQHPHEWRLRELFEHAGVDSQRIEIHRPGRFVLEKSRRDWMMTHPIRTRLDGQAMSEFLSRLSSIEASGFIMDLPDDLSRFGLADTGISFAVTTSVARSSEGSVQTAEQTERLLIGSESMRTDEFYAMIEVRPVVLSVSVPVLQFLLEPERLIDPTPSGVDPADVRSIRISGDEEFNLIRDDADPMRWLSPDFDNAAVPADVVTALLEHITQTRASNLQQAEYPRQQQVAYVMMSGFDGGPLDTVRIAHDKSSGRWIMNNGDGLLRFFPESIQLPLRPQDFGLKAR